MRKWRHSSESTEAQIKTTLAKAKKPLLFSYDCFDLFTDPTGEKVAADRNSIAYRFHYRDATSTLKTSEIDEAHKRILELLKEIQGISFR